MLLNCTGVTKCETAVSISHCSIYICMVKFGNLFLLFALKNYEMLVTVTRLNKGYEKNSTYRFQVLGIDKNSIVVMVTSIFIIFQSNKINRKTITLSDLFLNSKLFCQICRSHSGNLVVHHISLQR